MTDRLEFEAHLEERLLARAAIASRPFDAAAIAHQAALAGGRRRFGPTLWLADRPALRWTLLVLLAMAIAAGIVVGARLLQSPTGWIAYRSGSEIIAVDATNPDHRRVIGQSLGADPIAWAPDGSGLLLRPHPDVVPVWEDGMWWIPVGGTDSPLDLFVLHVDGSRTRLTQDGTGTWGSFSPDGTKVAYACCGSAPGPYVVEADGGKPRSLLGEVCRPPGCGEPLSEWAAWSPVSSEIAYLDFWEDHPTFGHHADVLSFVGADGTGLREGVLQLPGEAGGLAWSPDGLRLSFWMTTLGENGEEQLPAQIYVVNADGSGLRPLTDEGDNRWPSWSPDGTRIAFARGQLSFLTGGDGSQIEYVEPGSRRLFTMASDGTDVASVEGVHPEGPIAWGPVP
jgi:Tol biopolymer transport system component